MDHVVLVKRAKHWLMYTKRCRVVLTEIATAVSETPDAIGWTTDESIIIECKVSLADYRADGKKSCRTIGGMGEYRYYMTPPGLLRGQDTGPWGLLEVHDRVVRIVKEAERIDIDEISLRNERKVLLSACWRIMAAADLLKPITAIDARDSKNDGWTDTPSLSNWLQKVPTNNVASNLEITTNSAHRRLHAAEQPRDKKGRFRRERA